MKTTRTGLLSVALILSYSVFCQKMPPKTNPSCASIEGVFEQDLTDKEGIALKYSEDQSVIFYNKYPFNGKLKTCEKNKITSITTFVNGKKEGEFYGYYPNGKLAYFKLYGKNNSEPILYYDQKNGKSILIDDGILQGKEIHFQESGIIDFQGLNIDGNRSGKWEFYDSSGLMEKVIIYENGVIISCSGNCK